MPVHTEMIKLKTKPNQFYELTDKVKGIIKSSELFSGLCIVFCPGSTGAVILNENDPMLLKDLKDVLENVASQKNFWTHTDNAYSHIRATLLGPSVSVPIEEGRATLGQWQSVLFYEADTKARDREIIVTIVGEYEE